MESKPWKSVARLWPLLAFVLMGASSSKLAPGDTLESICGATLKAAGNKAAGAADGVSQMKLRYCEAARDNQKAIDANNAAFKIWAGVAAVCTGTCVAALAGHSTSPYVCAGVNATGGAAEALYIKEFGGLITGLIGGATSVAVSKTVTKGRDLGSCAIAGVAAFRSHSQYKNVGTNRSDLERNLISARELGGGASGVAVAAVSTAGSDGTGGASSGSQTSSQLSAGDRSSSDVTASNCGGLIQCAVAADSGLSGIVNNGRLEKDFQKLAGFPLSELGNKDLTASQALAGSLGGSLSQSQVATLASGLQNLNMRMEGDTPESMMASGGGGGAGGNAGGAGDDMAQIAGLLGQFMPGAKGEEPGTPGMKAVVFANQQRGPAAVAEDKSLNIFDRITFRYYAVSARLGGKTQ